MLPSVFVTANFFYDSIVWLSLSLIFSLFIIFISYRVYKSSRISFSVLSFCRHFPQLIVPLLSFPLFFRISFSIERIFHFYDWETILTFTFYIFTALIFLFNHFIASVFLINFGIVSQTSLDEYDGKSYLALWFIRCFYTVTFLLLPMYKNFFWSILFIIIHFIVLVFIIYKRIFTVVHISLYGQYIEIAPLFCFPFIFTANCYCSFIWTYCIPVLVVLHVLFVFFINFVRVLMKDLSYRVFSPYIHHDASMISIPKFVPGNMSSILRIMAMDNSDPSVFSRFMINQQQTRIRTSVLIELCRFFSIFPEMRETMLKEITNRNSNSIYNCYLISLFTLILTSLKSDISSDNELKELDHLYTEYSAHSYLYWKARQQKMVIKVFFESLCVSYLYIEVDNEIQALSRQYPLSPTLYHISAEISLILYGDFESYKKLNKVARKLENIKESIDPVLHQVGINNPKVLHYSLANTSIATGVLRSSSSDTFHRMRTKKRNRTEKAIISKLVKSERRLPYAHYFHYILPCVIILIAAIYCFPFKDSYDIFEKEIRDMSNSLTPAFYSTVSTSYVSYIYSLREDLLDDDLNCNDDYNNFIQNLFGFYQESSFSHGMSSSMLVTTINEISTMYAGYYDDICDVLPILADNMTTHAFNHTELLIMNTDSLLVKIKDSLDFIEDEYNFISMSIIAVIIFVVFMVIYFALFCHSMNSIMKDNIKAIEFLSSKSRINSILEKLELKKNFWNYFDPSTLVNSDSSIPFDTESESKMPVKLTPSRYQSSATSSANILRIPLPTPTDSFLSINNNVTNNNDSTDTSESEHFSNRMPMKLAPKFGPGSSFTGSGLNVLRQPRTFEMEEGKSKLDPSTISDEVFNMKTVEDGDMTSSNDENNITESDDQVSTLLQSVESSGKKYSAMFIYLTLVPWIFLLLIALFLIYPIKFENRRFTIILSTTYDISFDVFESFLLINSSVVQMYTGYCNSSFYTEIDNRYYNSGSSISELYNKQRCFENETETLCFNIHSIISALIENNFTQQTMATYYMQSIISFSEECLRGHLIRYINRDSVRMRSYASSFYVLAAGAIIVVIVYGFKTTNSFRKGLNSLFHFPSFEEKHTKHDLEIESKLLDSAITLPSNAILVTSVAETDEIYSISDTCVQILNKKSSELICRKLSKTFPIISSKEFEIRECNGKTFISKSKRNGTLIKTLLIENSRIEPKLKQANVQKLINFFPNIFVKSFSEDFINSYQFKSCYLIFVRIDSNAGQIETFINNLHNKVEQMFFGIEFIRANGSILTYISHDRDNLEIILFLRDIIQQAEESCKKVKANYALRSIYVDYIDELNVDILDGGTEPFAKIEEESFYKMETNAYLVNNKFIGGSRNSFLAYGKLKTLSKEENIQECQLFTIPFTKFVEDIEQESAEYAQQ